jgi:hypothetical protein
MFSSSSHIVSGDGRVGSLAQQCGREFRTGLHRIVEAFCQWHPLPSFLYQLQPQLAADERCGALQAKFNTEGRPGRPACA